MDPRLGKLVDLVERRLQGASPHVIGIAGAVAVGKSTVAEALAGTFGDRDRRTVVVATDAFLFPNGVLAERNAVYRKGFPETYDWDAIVSFVTAVKSQSADIRIPVYSHRTYDIVPGESTLIAAADLVLLEGVVALQPPLLPLLDVAVYVDADEAAVRSWFAERFVRLTAEARAGADSFYRMFAQMSDDEVRAAADGTWDAINGPNLHEHIEATRANAMIVVEKGPDHSIVAVREIF
jgi:type I pantothenate kinase